MEVFWIFSGVAVLVGSTMLIAGINNYLELLGKAKIEEAKRGRIMDYKCDICKKPESEVGNLRSGRVNSIDYQICNNCFKNMITTLTPMKPYGKEYDNGHYSNCHDIVFEKEKYCPNCGQKLDWEEE